MPGGRPPGPSGKPKTGGRQKGSIDREQRKLLTDRMAADLMYCYAKLGGRNWLLAYAREQPGEFIRQGLSRLFPAPQRDDPDAQINVLSVGSLSDLDAAMRVAFALERGLRAAQEQQPPVIEAEPAEPPHRRDELL